MAYTYDHPHPAVTTDIVIFTVRDRALKVLLIKRAQEPFLGAWALPGGFVEAGESLEDCACRELEEETGVRGVYLEQLYSFGRPDRDPRERVITVAYFALIPADGIVFRAADDSEAAGWFELDAIPELAFDHDEILGMARRRLLAKLEYSAIALHLMPAEFTAAELQEVYQSILAEPVDGNELIARMLSLNALEETAAGGNDGAQTAIKRYRVVRRGIL